MIGSSPAHRTLGLTLHKIKKDAKPATTDGEASPKTPKKATPTKRKSTGKAMDEDVDMNDEKEVTPSPSPKRTKKAAAKKSEDADEDVKEEDVKEEDVKEEAVDEVEA